MMSRVYLLSPCLLQVFVAVSLPSLAYREASDYNADLEGIYRVVPQITAPLPQISAHLQGPPAEQCLKCGGRTRFFNLEEGLMDFKNG